MKIFNREKENEKVYVQLNDIMELTQTNMPIPASIIDKVFGTQMLIVDDSNRDDFVEFDKQEEIDFFKSIDWIINYKKYGDLTEEELELLIKEASHDLESIANKYNHLSYDEKENNLDLYNDYIYLNYKIEGLRQLQQLKNGDYNPPFPIVPDSDGFSLGCDDENNPFELSASLAPNKYLLYRNDGEEVNSSTVVPSNFIQSGLCLALMQRKNGPAEGECEISFNFSEDNKYLIINLKELDKKEYKDISKEPEEKGFRKLLNKVFKKKKSY